jgi:hypothetical protein
MPDNIAGQSAIGKIKGPIIASIAEENNLSDIVFR